jgi:hypothetical protein
VVADEDKHDEAVSEGCSLEHIRWWRGNVMTVKRGFIAVGGAPRVELAFYRGRGSAGEATTGGNERRLMVFTSLMAGLG